MWALLALLPSSALCQSAAVPPASLVDSGRVTVAGRSVPYRIRRLPVDSFPDVPQVVAGQLSRRGCMIPQTYEAHRPENVVHASLERPGSSDWAVLCSVSGTVSLLVFFESDSAAPFVLASAPEALRLQVHPGTDVLGFNWGIDPASPERVRQAQIGLQPRPIPLDHDALADSVVDHSTVYHFYRKNTWVLVELPVP